jgi:hypothetical protein
MVMYELLLCDIFWLDVALESEFIFKNLSKSYDWRYFNLTHLSSQVTLCFIEHKKNVRENELNQQQQYYV